MAGNSRTKARTLALARMLWDETSPERGLTMSQILERLSAEGVPTERKAVYRNVTELRRFGFDIRTYQRNPVEYALASRLFDPDELSDAVAAVSACRGIPKRRRKAICSKLAKLAPKGDRQQLLGIAGSCSDRKGR